MSIHEHTNNVKNDMTWIYVQIWAYQSNHSHTMLHTNIWHLSMEEMYIASNNLYEQECLVDDQAGNCWLYQSDHCAWNDHQYACTTLLKRAVGLLVMQLPNAFHTVISWFNVFYSTGLLSHNLYITQPNELHYSQSHRHLQNASTQCMYCGVRIYSTAVKPVVL